MYENQKGESAVCETRFEEIRVGQYFEFRGERYKKVALSMAQDEKGWGNVFSAETEVLPGGNVASRWPITSPTCVDVLLHLAFARDTYGRWDGQVAADGGWHKLRPQRPLLNLEGVLTALLAWFVFKENFDVRILRHGPGSNTGV